MFKSSRSGKKHDLTRKTQLIADTLAMIYTSATTKEDTALTSLKTISVKRRVLFSQQQQKKKSKNIRNFYFQYIHFILNQLFNSKKTSNLFP